MTAATDSRSNPVIAIDRVSMVFAGRDPGQSVHALDDISLTIGKGEFVCLLGPSGCGKSTLLSIIGGMLAPSAGAVAVNRLVGKSGSPPKWQVGGGFISFQPPHTP